MSREFYVGQKVVCVAPEGELSAMINANSPDVGGVYTIASIHTHLGHTVFHLKELVRPPFIVEAVGSIAGYCSSIFPPLNPNPPNSSAVLPKG